MLPVLPPRRRRRPPDKVPTGLLGLVDRLELPPPPPPVLDLPTLSTLEVFWLLVAWCDEHLVGRFLTEFDKVSTALLVIFGGGFLLGWLLHLID